MQNYNWQLDNFALGMHTEPAKTQGGERYAGEIQNLRIDSDGWLRERSKIMAVGSINAKNITGIAATPKHVFVLRSTTIPAGVSVEYALSLQDATEVIRATRTFEIDITLGGIGVDIDEVGVFPTFFWIGRETDPDVWGNLVDGTEIEIQQGENIVQLRTTSRQSIDTALATYNAELISGEISNLLDGADTTVRITSSSYTDNYWHADKLDTDTAIRFGTGDPVSWRSGQPLDTASGLFVRDRDDLETETHIAGVADLEGRISVVDFNTYVIITSEGEDQGYMIDLREGEGYENIQLGLDAPDPIAAPDSLGVTLVHTLPNGVESAGEGDLSDGSYIYTYAYLLNEDDDELPWNNMQSDLWAVWGEAVTIMPSEDINYARVAIAYSDNLYATHIRIYRAHINDQYNLKQVADLPISGSGTIIFYDGYSDNEIDDPEKERRASDQNIIVNRRFKTNERLPAEVKQIFKYNDLIFAPAGDRLIYSDIQLGSLVPWAYPAVNEIRTGEQITFCAELREVLLFGGRGRLSRLTGTDEYNFNIDTLSHRGPLDGYSWNRLTEVLAYIGEGGFFVTDASSVKPLSDPVLNRIFKDKKLLTGSVVFLQDGDILYDFKTPDGRYQYKLEDGAWARWTGIDIVQAATIIEKVSDVDQATLVLLADGTGQLKELNWNSTEGADNADWRWESNVISGLSEGVANKFKRFRELEWTGQADGDVTLEVFNADAADTALSTIEFDSRDSLRPVRIPINRRMRRMIFRVSGTGTVKLQGLRLEMQV